MVNSVSSLVSVGNYQLSSNNFSMNSNSNRKPINNPMSSSMNDTSTALIHKSSITTKSSSPPKLIGMHTNTLPSNVGRSNNIQYQSESNYSLKQKQNKPFTTSPANNSPFNAFNSISSSATTSIANSTSNQTITNAINSIGGSSKTLLNSHSKNLNSYDNHDMTNSLLTKSSNSNTTGGIHVSAVASEFEQIIARNAGNASNFGSGNYNTIGSYRVQYSSTNPFLPSFNDTDDK